MIQPMFGSLGFPELIFIFLLALLIFGPKKLPELGRTLGKAMAEFRKATTDLKRTINAELLEQELRDADPRKIVRDSLREAKASLENAVREDDARANAAPPAAPAAAVTTAAVTTAAATAVTTEASAASANASGEPVAAPVASAAAPTFEPAGVVARGAAFEDDAGADDAPQTDEAGEAVASSVANAPLPATST